MRRIAMMAVLGVLLITGCGEDEGPTTSTPIGSCCAPDGTCTLTPQAACSGTWIASVVCTPDPCPPPSGSCCAVEGTCTIASQAECAGTWTEAGVCTPNPCPAPGSCCAPDNSCTITTSDACGGVWMLHGVCSPSPCTTPPGMRLIPPGVFTMGSPASEPGRWPPSETPHQVTLTKAIYVGIHEVTQLEWEEAMGWNDSRFVGAHRPVETVTWFDAVSYCNERSAAEGLAAAYTITEPVYQWYHLMSATVAWNPAATGYRLLTEAEWEHACRATSVTAFWNGAISDTSCTPVDPRLDQVGWYCGNAAGTTHDVGEKAANAWGLREMHGNVWEWCWDYWEASYGGDAIDPTGPATGSDRVMRGGGWSADARRCRSAHRAGDYPHDLYSGLGLRVCRTAL